VSKQLGISRVVLSSMELVRHLFGTPVLSEDTVFGKLDPLEFMHTKSLSSHFNRRAQSRQPLYYRRLVRRHSQSGSLALTRNRNRSPLIFSEDGKYPASETFHSVRSTRSRTK
jgi:hypothetical protein